MPILPKGIKIYRKIRYRKGHGVHSPFAYNLITKVIEEKSPYYVFEEIENIRKEIQQKKSKFSRITSKCTQHQKYGALLFRLVNFFQCKNVVQIGSDTGIMSLYLGANHSNCECIVLEEDNELVRFTEEVIQHGGLKGTKVLKGDYLENIHAIFSNGTTFDLIFINILKHNSYPKILDQCLSHLKNNGLLVIDGIHKSKLTKNAWREVVKNDRINVSVDLYSLGIAFVKEGIHKQHYKTYFDDGKKQYLYKNGRQRFHIFGRR